MPREMLDQNPREALERAADRAVHHHGPLLLAIGVDVEGTETLRQVEVHLRRPALPVTADRIAQHIFELRPVEGALAGIDAGLDAIAGTRPDLLQNGAQNALGM